MTLIKDLLEITCASFSKSGKEKSLDIDTETQVLYQH